jgi:hypothetical protein
MIIYGINRLFGRTDRIPGLLFVATTFFHIFFIPLIPTGSYLVMEKDDQGDSFRGISIPFSIKSWLYGWCRAVAVLTIPFVLYGFYEAYTRTIYSTDTLTHWQMSPGWQGIFYICIAILAWWVMRVTSTASAARQAELLQMAGLKIIQASGYSAGEQQSSS